MQMNDLPKNPWYLAHLEDQPESYCVEMMHIDGMALKYVKRATRAVCKAAVTNNGCALGYVPKSLRTPALCKLAVTKHGDALGYVPKPLRTPELCQIALDNCPEALLHVEAQTEDMCVSAVSRDLAAFCGVKKMTQRIADAAFANNKIAYRWLKPQFRTPEMDRVMVASRPRSRSAAKRQTEEL
jgi:hypothetical protein